MAELALEPFHQPMGENMAYHNPYEGHNPALSKNVVKKCLGLLILILVVKISLINESIVESQRDKRMSPQDIKRNKNALSLPELIES